MFATKIWQEYDFDYEKQFCDIRTKDNKEYINCYPNAGKWIVLSSKNPIEILDKDVTHIKLTEDKYLF